jgi:cellulose synthase/poly-beta-1,6-N-acetylglucosamine synthase-like glycosyltransferase
MILKRMADSTLNFSKMMNEQKPKKKKKAQCLKILYKNRFAFESLILGIRFEISFIRWIRFFFFRQNKKNANDVYVSYVSYVVYYVFSMFVTVLLVIAHMIVVETNIAGQVFQTKIQTVGYLFDHNMGHPSFSLFRHHEN